MGILDTEDKKILWNRVAGKVFHNPMHKCMEQVQTALDYDARDQIRGTIWVGIGIRALWLSINQSINRHIFNAGTHKM